jgi:hypothetical protein
LCSSSSYSYSYLFLVLFLVLVLFVLVLVLVLLHLLSFFHFLSYVLSHLTDDQGSKPALPLSVQLGTDDFLFIKNALVEGGGDYS